MNAADIKNSAIGILATSSGTAISFLQNVELYLRISSLVVGLAVGLISLYRMLKRKN